MSEEDPVDQEELDEYYKEVGVEPSEMRAPKKEAVYKTKEKSGPTKRSQLIDKMLDTVRTNPNYKVINRVIQVVKSVFTDSTDQGKEEEEVKAPKQANLGLALGSEEYHRLLVFFASELPTIMLQQAGVAEFGKKVDLKKAYSGLTSKFSILLKSYSANYTRLLSDALHEQNLAHLGYFFANASDTVRCILPFKVYTKKLAIICARTVAMYSKVDKAAMVMAFNSLRTLIHWAGDKTLFESVMKKFYNEFARESKVGGGGLLVQDRMRISQNCFVELLDFNRSIGYQLGF